MEIIYQPSFIRDFNNIKNLKDQKAIFKICFEEIKTIKNISEIKNLKKIKGYENYYRLRKGDYRIGIRIESDRITFMRVLMRDIIYRYFP